MALFRKLPSGHCFFFVSRVFSSTHRWIGEIRHGVLRWDRPRYWTRTITPHTVDVSGDSVLYNFVDKVGAVLSLLLSVEPPIWTGSFSINRSFLSEETSLQYSLEVKTNVEQWVKTLVCNTSCTMCKMLSATFVNPNGLCLRCNTFL